MTVAQLIATLQQFDERDSVDVVLTSDAVTDEVREIESIVGRVTQIPEKPTIVTIFI